MTLASTLHDHVLELVLDRPHCLNAVDEATARSLLIALRKADRQDDVHAVLLRGAGRAFCAGRDVSAPPSPAILQLVQAASLALVECRKPVVCAVHGWVVGLGVEWMLDCDLVVAARGARFKLPEIELGVFVTGGVSATLPRAAGLLRAKHLLLLGEPFDAAQAEAWGLVGTVVDDEALEAEAWRLARRVAGFEPAVAARFKRVLHSAGLERFGAALEAESSMHGELAALSKPAPLADA